MQSGPPRGSGHVVLEHLPALEDPEDDADGDAHEDKNDEPGPVGVADEPSELDVHAEETGDEGRRHEHEGHKGEDLHDLVLVEIDDTENGVLQVFKTLEAEVGMIDQRRNVFQKDIQTRTVLRRIVGTFENAGYNPLLVNDILTDEHGVFLQDVDVDKELFTDIFTDADLSVVLIDFLGDKFDHVCIKVNTVFQDAQEGHMTRLINLRESHEAPLKVCETFQRALPQSREYVFGKYE